MLQLFDVPQIGYSATSKDLRLMIINLEASSLVSAFTFSDKSRFGYFFRVVPSDYYQVRVPIIYASIVKCRVKMLIHQIMKICSIDRIVYQ